MYIIYYTKDAKSHLKTIYKPILKDKVDELITLIGIDPFKSPPPYKKLLGIYNGAYSRRINLQHRLFYQVDEQKKYIKILGIWGHYKD